MASLTTPPDMSPFEPDTFDLAKIPPVQRAATATRMFCSNDSELVQSVKVLSINEVPTTSGSFSQLRHFESEVVDSTGKVVSRPNVETFEFCAEQDVADILPVYWAGNEWRFIVTKNLRPVLAVRSAYKLGSDVFADRDSDINSGQLWNLPGGYIRVRNGESGLRDAISRVVLEKTGLEIELNDRGIPKIEFLGSAVPPSVQNSTEIAFPRAVYVNPPKFEDSLTFGEDFQRSRRNKSWSAQEVINGFFSGEIQDFRLVEAVFRFARIHKIEISVPSEMNLEKYARDINLSEMATPFRRLDELQTWIASSPLHQQNVRPTTLDALDRKQQPRLKHYEANVENVGTSPSGESTILDRYKVEYFAANSSDTVDVGALSISRSDGALLTFRRLPRLALEARKFGRHPILNDSSSNHVELISVGLKPDQGLEHIKSKGDRAILEHCGLQPIDPQSHPIYLGSSFPSPAASIEKVHHVFRIVDPTSGVPTTPSLADQDQFFPEEICTARCVDIANLVVRGVAIDPRLSFLAHIALAATGELLDEVRLPSALPSELSGLLEELDSGSHLESVLIKHGQDYYQDLAQLPVIRKLIERAENEKGLVFLREDSAEEASFEENASCYFYYQGRWSPTVVRDILHDLYHFWQPKSLLWESEGGKILLDQDGKPKRRKIREYMNELMEREVTARWFSEVILPEKLGAEKSLKYSDGITLGEAFLNMGMNGEEILDAMRSIETNGKIPPTLRSHPRFEEYRHVIVERGVKKHVMERYQQLSRFRQMAKNHYLAQTLARIYDAHEDDGSTTFTDYLLGRTRREPESTYAGSNGFRRATARLSTQSVLLPLNQLAHCCYLMEQNGIGKWRERVNVALQWRERLFEAHDELRRLKLRINSSEANEENLVIFRERQRLERETLQPAREFIDDLISDTRYLTREQIASFRGRALPAFEKMKIIPPEKILRRVDLLSNS